jgi:hypothetical protein
MYSYYINNTNGVIKMFPSMTYANLKKYALSLNYKLSEDDCAEIIETYPNWSIEAAVNDFLNCIKGE